MKWNGIIASAAAVALLTGLTACGEPAQTPNEPEPTPVVTETPGPVRAEVPIWVEITSRQGEATSRQGETVMTYDWQQPRVTGVPGAEQINAALQQKEEDFLHGTGGVEELSAEAEEFYNTCGELGSTYALSSGVSVARADDRVISLIFGDYAYTGGAHGYTGTSGWVYDSRTGQRLGLADLSGDETALKAFFVQYITELSKTEEYTYDGQSLFFDDYEQWIPDVVADGLWYFDNEGITFVSQPYVLSSYAAGTIFFPIPYEDLEGVIDSRWLPETAAPGGEGKLVLQELGEQIPEGLLYDGEPLPDSGHVMFTAQGDVYALTVSQVLYFSEGYGTRQRLYCDHLMDGEQFAVWEVFPAPDRVQNAMENGLDWTSTDGLLTLELSYLDGNGIAHRERVLLDEEGALQLKTMDGK